MQDFNILRWLHNQTFADFILISWQILFWHLNWVDQLLALILTDYYPLSKYVKIMNRLTFHFSFVTVTFWVYHNFCINHLQIPIDIKYKLENIVYIMYCRTLNRSFPGCVQSPARPKWIAYIEVWFLCHSIGIYVI